jgi:serum/glucocorticoid-regulated kinase 2
MFLVRWGWTSGPEENADCKIFRPPGHSGRLVEISEGTLIHAVIQGDRDLLGALVEEVQRNDRVSATKALGLAVEQRDKAMVRILLDSGVNCDFQDSNRPSPLPYGGGCTFGVRVTDNTEPPEFIPPLVRAVKLGDIDLVKILLASGADANVGFHDSELECDEPEGNTSQLPVIKCGRVVQLAMAFGHEEIVQLLLASGVNINLPAPVCRHHDCQPIEKPVYLEITALLRQRVEERST